MKNDALSTDENVFQIDLELFCSDTSSFQQKIETIIQDATVILELIKQIPTAEQLDDLAIEIYILMAIYGLTLTFTFYNIVAYLTC